MSASPRVIGENPTCNGAFSTGTFPRGHAPQYQIRFRFGTDEHFPACNRAVGKSLLANHTTHARLILSDHTALHAILSVTRKITQAQHEQVHEHALA